MNVILLSIVMLAMVLQSVGQKQYNKKTENKGTYIFNAVCTMSAAVLFLCLNKGFFQFEAGILPYVFGFAVAYGSAVLFSFLAIREGSMSFTCLATSYSLFIPTVYGLLFLKESASIYLYIGMALLALSIFFINNKKGDNAFTVKWLVFALLAFLGNGMASTVQTMQQLRFAGNYKSEFMIAALFIVSMLFWVLALVQEKDIVFPCTKKAGVYMIFTGLANAVVNLLVMTLVSRGMPASIMFPVISGGGIVLTTMVSVLFYKEKLTLQQYIGLLCGAASVVFMSL